MIKWLKNKLLELVVNVLRHECFCHRTKEAWNTNTTQVVYKMYEMTQRHVFVNTIYIFHIMQLHSEVLQIIKKIIMQQHSEVLNGKK